MLVQPMVMTGGGPSNSTYTVVYDIYETGTVNWEMGLASTMAIVFAVFCYHFNCYPKYLNQKTRRKNNMLTQKAKEMELDIFNNFAHFVLVLPLSSYLDVG